jgi:hypothetical protein
MVKLLIPIIFSILLSSCNTVPPWERGYLAKNKMQIGADNLGIYIHEHTFSSKEASNGGYGLTTGGCGCN